MCIQKKIQEKKMSNPSLYFFNNSIIFHFQVHRDVNILSISIICQYVSAWL